MNRLRGPAVIGAALTVLSGGIALSGCTAQHSQSDTSEEVQQWLDDLDIDGGDVLTSFRGGAALDWGDLDAIHVAFADDIDASVSHADVYCFGEDRVSVEVRLEGATSATTLREEDVPCDESPHTIDLTMDGVSAVGASAISLEGAAGWAVAVHGTESPSAEK
ncbi:hypothetical protein [Microbacterium sp. Bi121]|uniref:hypothetical protein n=1 Tax=Microbacterium sp. Bi121 TaxID=2822348 RepID=UPI001E448306|nr:hypothetical protein [Microbacterium sp. Bi121]